MGNNELELKLELIGEVAPQYLEAAEQQYNLLYTDLLLHAVFNNTRSISYSLSSITNGYLEFNYSSSVPMVERFFNLTNGSIYGNTNYYK
jgi:beta-mannosidase